VADAPAVEEAPAPEATPEPKVEEKPVEEVVEEKVEEPVEESSDEPELKAIVADLTKKVEAQAAELKAIKEQPVFKSTLSDNKPEAKKEISMLGLVG